MSSLTIKELVVTAGSSLTVTLESCKIYLVGAVRQVLVLLLNYVLVPTSTYNQAHILHRTWLPAKKVPVQNLYPSVVTEDIRIVNFVVRPAFWLWIVLTRDGVGVMSVRPKMFAGKHLSGIAVDYKVGRVDGRLQMKPMRGAFPVPYPEVIEVVDTFFVDLPSTADDSDDMRKSLCGLHLSTPIGNILPISFKAPHSTEDFTDQMRKKLQHKTASLE